MSSPPHCRCGRRPRRIGSTRLAQEAEERCSRSLIKTPDWISEGPSQLAVFLYVLFAAVRWSRVMAQDCVRGTAPFRTRLDNNGQTSILAGDGYDVNDPKPTKIASTSHCAHSDRKNLTEVLENPSRS